MQSHLTPAVSTPAPKPLTGIRRLSSEAGKVGLAVLMWMLGVPGLLVLAYLIFA